eukprot:CAMPEP_0184692690 /NCGR_PEP_ID=MMETSP0313-20130426/1058_1 /TAXON_ID=2792 /ORGANISM="Porphyridium aerugineum, Strain SAG 1380-2" /LENGTH=496 /DNA_ID=CAMNT_0027150539 /DNA_START=264 /DNA_END=1754 /DNA_ORIENTATION=+
MASYVFLPPPTFQIKNKIKELMEDREKGLHANIHGNVDWDIDGDKVKDKDWERRKQRQRQAQVQGQGQGEVKGRNANGKGVGTLSRPSEDHEYYHHQHHLHQQQLQQQQKSKQRKAPASATNTKTQLQQQQQPQQPEPVPATQQPQKTWGSERSLIIRKTIAGAFAEAFSVILLYPLDTIKLYKQSCVTTSKGLARAPTAWPSTRTLYAGLPQSVLGAAASAAIFALIYHVSKRAFRRRFSTPNFTFISRIFAGVSATAVSALIDSPVLFVRNQLRLGKNGTNLKEVLHFAVESNGVCGLYTGFRSQLLNNLPFDTLELATYEHLRRMFKPGFLCWGKTADSPCNGMNAFVPNVSPSPNSNPSPSTSQNIASPNCALLPTNNNSLFTMENLEYLLLGMLTGAVVGAITNPLDVLRSRIITRPARYQGIRYSARLIWRREGMRGFAAGLGPKVAHETLNSGVFFLLYEMAYNAMERWQDMVPKKNSPVNAKAASVSM